MSYADSVTAEGRAPEPQAAPPRIAVVRSFADMKLVLALLEAARPVLVVLRANDDDRQRVLDVLTGWAHGANADLDELGSNAVVARPPGSPPVRLSRSDIVTRVEATFESQQGGAWNRDEERELLVLAAAGSADARRRISDAYSEIASVLALALRPPHLQQSVALRLAHEELERLVGWLRPDVPLLVALTNAIHDRLSQAGR